MNKQCDSNLTYGVNFVFILRTKFALKMKLIHYDINVLILLWIKNKYFKLLNIGFSIQNICQIRIVSIQQLKIQFKFFGPIFLSLNIRSFKKFQRYIVALINIFIEINTKHGPPTMSFKKYMYRLIFLQKDVGV